MSDTSASLPHGGANASPNSAGGTELVENNAGQYVRRSTRAAKSPPKYRFDQSEETVATLESAEAEAVEVTEDVQQTSVVTSNKSSRKRASTTVTTARRTKTKTTEDQEQKDSTKTTNSRKVTQKRGAPANPKGAGAAKRARKTSAKAKGADQNGDEMMVDAAESSALSSPPPVSEEEGDNWGADEDATHAGEADQDAEVEADEESEAEVDEQASPKGKTVKVAKKPPPGYVPEEDRVPPIGFPPAWAEVWAAAAVFSLIYTC